MQAGAGSGVVNHAALSKGFGYLISSELVNGRRGNGVLTPVTTVQRINTNGGKLDGACDAAGRFKSAPYSADYVFLRKG